MPNKPKFCIITTQRSGSTWLIQLLNSHPQIKTFNGEPFLWLEKRPELLKGKRSWFDDVFIPYYFYFQNSSVSRPWVMFNYLDILETYQSEPHEIIGFKIMYNQITRNPDFLLKIILDKYRIIHLVRKNYLDVLISTTVGNQYNLYHVKKSKNQISPVTLNPLSLIKTLNYYEKRYQFGKTFLKFMPLSVLEITYESLVSQKDKTLSLIADFLQVKSNSIVYKSNLKKANSGSYKDKITNYEEVVEVLKNSKYAHFLAD